jgi:hypothetical protein
MHSQYTSFLSVHSVSLSENSKNKDLALADLRTDRGGCHKKINQGPRNSLGQAIRAPAKAAVRDHVDATLFSYPYDGGFMAPAGIPSRKIGTPTTTPGDFALGLGQIPYYWMAPANPATIR